MPPQPPASPQSPGTSDADVACYVAEMCAELRSLMVRRPRLRTLAYLVDMARLEAEKAAGDPGDR